MRSNWPDWKLTWQNCTSKRHFRAVGHAYAISSLRFVSSLLAFACHHRFDVIIMTTNVPFIAVVKKMNVLSRESTDFFVWPLIKSLIIKCASNRAMCLGVWLVLVVRMDGNAGEQKTISLETIFISANRINRKCDHSFSSVGGRAASRVFPSSQQSKVSPLVHESIKTRTQVDRRDKTAKRRAHLALQERTHKLCKSDHSKRNYLPLGLNFQICLSAVVCSCLLKSVSGLQTRTHRREEKPAVCRCIYMRLCRVCACVYSVHCAVGSETKVGRNSQMERFGE